MKRSIIFLFILISAQVFAQTQTLKGRVVDSKTQEGIGFASIGVEGTFFGTASDADGYFELKINDNQSDEMLYISAVAYQNLSFEISELLTQDFIRISLIEQTYSIEGVDITALSRVLFRIITTASERIPENYYAEPIGLKFHYKEEKNLVGALSETREAIIDLYDETGYSKPSITDAYQNRNFQFIQVNKNFESYSFPAGQTGFDELLDMDMARLSNTIFNVDLLNDYDLHLEGISAYDGDSAWIISYKTNELDLAHTGDFNAQKMDGKMYILKSNFALVRNECIIEASLNNSQSRSLFTKNDAQQNVWYHFTTTYQKQGNKYAINYIDCDKTYTNEKGEQVSYSRKANVLELKKSPKKITGRNFFENATYEERFWNSFNSPMKL